MPFYGAAILCLDDENVQAILPAIRRRTITYGRSSQADYQPGETDCEGMHSIFRLRTRTADLGLFRVNSPGAHNVLNATAAIAVALELGVTLDVVREGLAKFTGVGRRFEVKGEVNGIRVVDDYGHHPTEIRATLAAARSCTHRPRPRAVPAASLHPHHAPDGRIRARLSSRRSRRRPRHLRRLGKAHRRRDRRRPWPSACASSAIATSTTPARTRQV